MFILNKIEIRVGEFILISEIKSAVLIYYF